VQRTLERSGIVVSALGLGTARVGGLGFSRKGDRERAQAVIDGTWQTGFIRRGLAEGFLEIAPFGDAVPDRVEQFVLAVAEGYKAGLIDTFIGSIADQDGVIRIPKGEFWGNELMGDWDFLLEGTIGEAQ